LQKLRCMITKPNTEFSRVNRLQLMVMRFLFSLIFSVFCMPLLKLSESVSVYLLNSLPTEFFMHRTYARVILTIGFLSCCII